MQQTEDGRPTEPEGETGANTRDALDREPGSAEIVAALENNYATVQYHFVQFLAEHLTDCRKSLGGDLDEIMIIAVLGQRFIGARLARDGGDESAHDRVWMSALRLSDVTGVPRESVRRKLKKLETRGWVVQDPVLGWRLSGSLDHTQVRADLGDVDRRGIQRLSRLLRALMPVLTAARPRDGEG
jgi:hypothetical protein